MEGRLTEGRRRGQGAPGPSPKGSTEAMGPRAHEGTEIGRVSGGPRGEGSERPKNGGSEKLQEGTDDVRSEESWRIVKER